MNIFRRLNNYLKCNATHSAGIGSVSKMSRSTTALAVIWCSSQLWGEDPAPAPPVDFAAFTKSMISNQMWLQKAALKQQTQQSSRATQFGDSPPSEFFAMLRAFFIANGIPIPPGFPMASHSASMAKLQKVSMQYLDDSSNIPKVLTPKDKPYQVFISPYYTKTYTKPTSEGDSGSATRQTGATLGGMIEAKAIGATLGVTLGNASSKTQYGSNPLDSSKEHNLNAGLCFSKPFFNDNLEYSISTNFMRMLNSQSRVGQDSLTNANYNATTKYKTYNVSINQEFGHSFAVGGSGFTFRPSLGIAVNRNHRPTYSENGGNVDGGTNNNQSYKKKNTVSGEGTATLALIKKWQSESVEGNLTISYGMGRQSGNGKASDKVYTDAAPAGIISSNKTTGRNTQYISILGEISQKDGEWSVNPGAFFAIQNKMKSSTGSIQFAYKW